jgi:DNA-binding MltR family transcriptional regulator
MNTFELMNEITNEIKESNDRACIILASSFIEELLRNILDEYLLKDNKSDKEIFDRFGPLSSFSAKIKMSYRLGLISKKEYTQIELFRKIRNKFAHELKCKSFNDADLRDLVNNLIIEKELIPISFYPLPKSREEELPIPNLVEVDATSPRDIIEKFVSYIINNLFGRMILAMDKKVISPSEFTSLYEPFEFYNKLLADQIKQSRKLKLIHNLELKKRGLAPRFIDHSKNELLIKIVNQMIEQAKKAIHN